MNKTFFILFSALFFCTLSFGQTKAGGTVIDEAGKAVPFANVVFQNSSVGTTTDENGSFYLQSEGDYKALVVSFVGYETKVVPLQKSVNYEMKIVLDEEAAALDEVRIFRGKTSKKNNPAVDILKKIWEHKRENGLSTFDQYEYRKYEKLEFDLNGVDSTVIKNPVFNGMEFIFDYSDTNRITGKTYLPIFINEAVSKVYGDNQRNQEREDLLGNKNSGFNQNQNLIAMVKEIYQEYNIYDNYIQFFDKSFVSPLSTTGVNTYNYVLTDSAYVDKKWCYNIVYYPRRQNELTFKGDFWVNDTTWAIKKINLETSKKANINWVKDVYIEQEFRVLNDSVFLITKDFFQADFALNKKEKSKGVYAKRTTLYDNYKFDEPKGSAFYTKKTYEPKPEVYDRDAEFWQANRLEELDNEELGVYSMLDTLTKVPAFRRLYDIATIAESGYVEGNGWDFGPVYSVIGYNDVEGVRTRLGGRTYFGQNDMWRVEGYGAYGFKDKKFKYGISAKWLLDHETRLIVSGGRRHDIEQLGASLTNSTDVLGRSLASSSLLNTGANDKLSWIDLSTFAVQFDPVRNFTIRFGASYRHLSPASPGFSLSWYTDEAHSETSSEIDQTELSAIFTLTPGRRISSYGVEPSVVNDGDFPTFFLKYGLGLKNILHSDFDYKKLQFFYGQPLLIGGWGRAHASIEAGKTFGQVPLGLLSVVPGNQSFFAIYNTFPLLDFYEFVTDTYVSAQFEHNFNGRFFSRIPGLRALNLREIVGIRGVWGQISEENRALDASGLNLRAPDGDPYWEYSVGVGNIFKFIRIDAHFRGDYFDNPGARKFGVTMGFGFHY
ncbi:MAG: DUF5686 family protein [Salegentibacter sp.]